MVDPGIKVGSRVVLCYVPDRFNLNGQIGTVTRLDPLEDYITVDWDRSPNHPNGNHSSERSKNIVMLEDWELINRIANERR